jgi:YebC/PmpR family DNA-binding regulatory protein
MGRHATVAGRQASSAAARSKMFTKVAREITVAARAGGSDANSNARLRLAFDHARECNMPKDTAERLAKKAAGELDGITYEECAYEGYGPSGMAVFAEVMTDNRNRTQPELKRIFTKNGGNIAQEGTVAWMFQRKGAITVSGASEDGVMEIALNAGADDVITDGDFVVIYTDVSNFSPVRAAIEKANMKIERSGLDFVPSNTVSLKGEDAKNALSLIAALEDQDDVQNVYHNAEFTEEDLNKYAN